MFFSAGIAGVLCFAGEAEASIRLAGVTRWLALLCGVNAVVSSFAFGGCGWCGASADVLSKELFEEGGVTDFSCTTLCVACAKASISYTVSDLVTLSTCGCTVSCWAGLGHTDGATASAKALRTAITGAIRTTRTTRRTVCCVGATTRLDTDLGLTCVDTAVSRGARCGVAAGVAKFTTAELLALVVTTDLPSVTLAVLCTWADVILWDTTSSCRGALTKVSCGAEVVGDTRLRTACHCVDLDTGVSASTLAAVGTEFTGICSDRDGFGFTSFAATTLFSRTTLRVCCTGDGCTCAGFWDTDFGAECQLCTAITVGTTVLTITRHRAAVTFCEADADVTCTTTVRGLGTRLAEVTGLWNVFGDALSATAFEAPTTISVGGTGACTWVCCTDSVLIIFEESALEAVPCTADGVVHQDFVVGVCEADRVSHLVCSDVGKVDVSSRDVW